MATAKSKPMPEPQAVEHEDVTRILGEQDDATLMAILALKPTVSDLEQAAAHVAGDAELLGKAGHPLSGTVADIVDILTADEEEPPPTS